LIYWDKVGQTYQYIYKTFKNQVSFLEGKLKIYTVKNNFVEKLMHTEKHLKAGLKVWLKWESTCLASVRC
jgi:hypothetical protein